MGNTVKTTFLLALMTVLFVLVGKAIGGQSGMVFAFGLAVVMNVGSYWFSDKIVLRMYGAREVTESEAPQLHSIVRRLTIAAGRPDAEGVRHGAGVPQRVRHRSATRSTPPWPSRKGSCGSFPKRSSRGCWLTKWRM